MRPRIGRPPRGRQGFTLIEILIVVVMIALIAGFAVPKLNIAKFKADAGARLLVSTMQLAERTAVQRQHDVVLGFDLTNHRIRIHEDRNNNRALDTGEPVRWRTLEEGIRFQTPPRSLGGGTSGLAAVTGSDIRTIDGMPTIIVHRDGSTNTSAELFLTTPRGALGDFRGVRLTQATGRLTWWIYNPSGSWTEMGR